VWKAPRSLKDACVWCCNNIMSSTCDCSSFFGRVVARGECTNSESMTYGCHSNGPNLSRRYDTRVEEGLTQWTVKVSSSPLKISWDRVSPLPVSVKYVRSVVREREREREIECCQSVHRAVTEIVRRHLGAQHSHAWIGTSWHGITRHHTNAAPCELCILRSTKVLV
jgi:hypothetical protein